MQTVTKALVGSAVAGAMALTAATPAAAQYRERDRGIDAGDVIAGALIIGGIAAVASAAACTLATPMLVTTRVLCSWQSGRMARIRRSSRGLYPFAGSAWRSR